MKKTGIQRQIINATPTSYKNSNKTKSGATTLGYVVLLGFTIMGGIAAYYGVAYNSNLIFEQQAILEGNNTSTTLLGINTSATQLALVSSITVMAATLLFGGLFLRNLYRKPKAEPSDNVADEELSTGTQQCLTEKRQQMRRLFLGKVKSSPGFEPQVQHLMSKNVMTVPPQKAADQIAKTMDLYRVRHLLVSNKERQLCGIISDRDLRKQNVKTAADLMTADPITVSPDMAVRTAITIMLNHQISCLPVIEHGEVIGLLTTTDLTLSLQCSLQILAQLTGNPDSIETESFPQIDSPAAASLEENEKSEEDTPTEEELVSCY